MDYLMDTDNILQVLSEKLISHDSLINVHIEKLVLDHAKPMEYVERHKLYNLYKGIKLPGVLCNVFTIIPICKYDSVNWLKYYYEQYTTFGKSTDAPQAMINENNDITIRYYDIWDLTVIACEYDAVKCLRYLCIKGCKLNNFGANYCVINDYIDCLEIFFEYQFTFPKDIVDIAVKNNSLMCLQYLLIYGYTSLTALNDALLLNHIDCVQFLLDVGHKITNRTMYMIIENNCIGSLICLQKNKVKLDDCHLYHATLFKAERSILYLRSLNIVIDDVTSMTYDLKKLSLDRHIN
jgi:hypothetical protein